MADIDDKVNPAPAADAAIPLQPVDGRKSADKKRETDTVPPPVASTEPTHPRGAHITGDDEVTPAPPELGEPQAPAAAKQWGLEPPEILRHLSAEERAVLEKKLRRKIDLRLLPMIIIMYILNYIDRNNIAAARFAGLEEDLNMDAEGNQFSVGDAWPLCEIGTNCLKDGC